MTTHDCGARRMLRLPEVMALTGRGRSSIYADMAAGKMPKCIKIGPRAVAWDAGEIAAWQASKLAERDAASATTR
jgi:prophage regulatory protein